MKSERETTIEDIDLSLSASCLDLWWVELSRCPERPEWLDETELRRAERFKVAGKARELLRSHTALRGLIGAYLDRPPELVHFEMGDHGKPALRGGGLEFNLSHSGDWALIGVMDRGRLGVDVEQHADRPHDDIARRFFSPSEVDEYEGLEPALRKGAFYRGWTRKEAYLKAWGTGLRFSSRRFTVSLSVLDGQILRATEMPGDRPERWWFEHRDLGACDVAACWEGRREVRFRRFDPVFGARVGASARRKR